MKKILAILIVIIVIIVTLVVYQYNSYKTQILKTKKLNQDYEDATKGEILGTTLITIINKAIDSNQRNNIHKENNIYIENSTNSIKIEVKFLESENIFSMESIQKLGSEEFIKNYAAMSFKCRDKQYHEKTNNIKYMLFEQI